MAIRVSAPSSVFGCDAEHPETAYASQAAVVIAGPEEHFVALCRSHAVLLIEEIQRVLAARPGDEQPAPPTA